MKKICILTSGHFASDVRVFHKEARTLVEEGYEVSLIAQNKKNESPQGLKIITLPRSKGRSTSSAPWKWPPPVVII